MKLKIPGKYSIYFIKRIIISNLSIDIFRFYLNISLIIYIFTDIYMQKSANLARI